jgi:hypothetical protein
MSTRRPGCSAFLIFFLGIALLSGCAPTALSRHPDFQKVKPTLGTLVVLADLTSLLYKSGDIQKLDLVESEQLGTVLLNEMAGGLRDKGYVVGKAIHATVGWSLRPGTQVYLIRTVEDRDRDPLPLAEPPIYVNQELAGDPALKEAWQTLRSSSVTDADAGAAHSRLRQAFGADTLVTVSVAGRKVPTGTQMGRAMLGALTFGATSQPVTAHAWLLFITDTKGQIIWRDAATVQYVPLSEQAVKAIGKHIVGQLP